jgi:hypothetical protein
MKKTKLDNILLVILFWRALNKEICHTNNSSYDGEKTDIGMKKLVLVKGIYSYLISKILWIFLPCNISSIVYKQIMCVGHDTFPHFVFLHSNGLEQDCHCQKKRKGPLQTKKQASVVVVKKGWSVFFWMVMTIYTSTYLTCNLIITPLPQEKRL